MKKKYTLIGSIIIGIFLVIICTSSVNADPALMITSYTLDPEVLMPGDTAILTLSIKNAESTATNTRVVSNTGSTSTLSNTTVKQNSVTVDNIWIEADGAEEKNVKAVQNFYRETGDIAPGTTLSVSFEITAEDGIPEGIYYPTVHVDPLSGSIQSAKYPFKVEVSNTSLELISKDVPSKISKSGATDITVSLVNKREGSIESVQVTPEPIDGVTFTPEVYFVETISADSDEDVTFAMSSSGTGVKNVVFNVSYKNGKNVHYETLYADVEVVETLDVSPVIYELPTSISKGETTEIKLKVYNSKEEEITGVIVTPICNAKVVPAQYFIGSMDPDDIYSISFDVYTDDLNPDTDYPISFKISFKQDNNYYEYGGVSSSFSVLKATNGNGEDLAVVGGGLFILIIMVILVLFYLRRKRKLFWK